MSHKKKKKEKYLFQKKTETVFYFFVVVVGFVEFSLPWNIFSMLIFHGVIQSDGRRVAMNTNDRLETFERSTTTTITTTTSDGSSNPKPIET